MTNDDVLWCSVRKEMRNGRCQWGDTEKPRPKGGPARVRRRPSGEREGMSETSLWSIRDACGLVLGADGEPCKWCKVCNPTIMHGEDGRSCCALLGMGHSGVGCIFPSPMYLPRATQCPEDAKKRRRPTHAVIYVHRRQADVDNFHAGRIRGDASGRGSSQWCIS